MIRLVLDVLTLLITVGIAVYGIRLCLLFNGGMLIKPILALTVLSSVFAFDQAIQTVKLLFFPDLTLGLVRDIIELVIAIIILWVLRSSLKPFKSMQKP